MGGGEEQHPGASARPWKLVPSLASWKRADAPPLALANSRPRSSSEYGSARTERTRQIRAGLGVCAASRAQTLPCPGEEMFIVRLDKAVGGFRG